MNSGPMRLSHLSTGARLLPSSEPTPTARDMTLKSYFQSVNDDRNSSPGKSEDVPYPTSNGIKEKLFSYSEAVGGMSILSPPGLIL